MEQRPADQAVVCRQEVGACSAPRSLSGVWDAAELDGGRQPSGALEHPALLAPRGQGVEGGRPDETGIMRPLHYTPEGLEALKANKPSGPSVRQVPAALANDPVDQCDPIGFPRMELYELRTIELVQTANQVIYLNQFYGNYRVIWTDGRELPKDPEPRWNGYSVGKWVDDYTFVVETVGLNPQKLGGPRRASAQRRFTRGGNVFTAWIMTTWNSP